MGNSPEMKRMADIERIRERRHTNTLSTKKDRAAYTNAVATTLEKTALAFTEIARKLRENPEEVLDLAFTPNILVLDERPRVRIEVERPVVGENPPPSRYAQHFLSQRQPIHFDKLLSE